MRELSIARVPHRRLLGLAAALALAAGIFMQSATHVAAANTSLKVGYLSYGLPGSTDTAHPGTGIFKNALTNAPAAGSYTTADGTKTVTITDLTPTGVDAGGVAVLTPFDTVIVYQICDIGTTHLNTLKAINDYLKNGGKVMLFDADHCAPTTASCPPAECAGQADYSQFLFPFRTDSPGPQGGLGCYTNVQPSSLTTGLPLFCDTTHGVNDAVGDANIFTTPSGSWCASITGKNANVNTGGATGIVEAYARTPGNGLVVYEGEDFWFTWMATSHLRQVFDLMLKQNWNPDGLPSPGACQPASGISLKPLSQTQPAGGTATVIAHVQDVNGNPSPNIQVTFTVDSGPNAPLSHVAPTNASGDAPFSYTSTKVGVDTLHASFTDALNTVRDSNTVTVTWVPGPPGKLVLAPHTATNIVGSPHTVTATVTDAFGNPTPAVSVKFTVTGTIAATGTGVTDASGQTTFTYTSVTTGNDSITAQAQGGSNPSDVAAKTWTLAALDHFKCYLATGKAKEGDEDVDEDEDGHGFRRIVTLSDQFGTDRFSVEDPRLFCNPVSKDGSKIITSSAHLKVYEIESATDADTKERLVEVSNQFGKQTLEVDDPELLAEPAAKAEPGQVLGPLPITLNNFECYSVKGKAPRPAITVTLQDQFGTEKDRVGRPVLLCNPTKKNNEGIGPVIGGPQHLVCYSIQSSEPTQRRVVQTRDQFGVETLTVSRPTLLCVPSDKQVIAEPKDDEDDNTNGHHRE